MFASLHTLSAERKVLFDDIKGTGLPNVINEIICDYAIQFQFAQYFHMSTQRMKRHGRYMEARYWESQTLEWSMQYIYEHAEFILKIMRWPINDRLETMVCTYQPSDMWQFITDDPLITNIIIGTFDEEHKRAVLMLRAELREILQYVFIVEEAASIARQRFAGRTAILSNRKGGKS